MRPSTLISMGLSGRAWLLLSLRHLSRPFYRLLFLASAVGRQGNPDNRARFARDTVFLVSSAGCRQTSRRS
jgi:hypothetical protein